MIDVLACRILVTARAVSLGARDFGAIGGIGSSLGRGLLRGLRCRCDRGRRLGSRHGGTGDIRRGLVALLERVGIRGRRLGSRHGGTTYYNYHRLHGQLGWQTPAERFEGTRFTDRGFEHVPARGRALVAQVGEGAGSKSDIPSGRAG